MNYTLIRDCDVANGEGIRISLFVSGCPHKCKGCFNQEAWDFNCGQEFTIETEDKIIKMLEPSYIKGFSLLGGEPMAPNNRERLLPFLKRLKDVYPNKDIWCWSGYDFEELMDLEILNYIDVIITGKFILEQRDVTLKFMGSRNQELIRLLH